MKTIKLTFTLFFALFVAISYAEKKNPVHPKIAKAKQLVKKTAENDWYTFAQCAKTCLKIGENLEEASLWLDQSISKHENKINWELKGDYFYLIGKPKEAIKCYTKSIEAGMKQLPVFSPKKLQLKILVLLKPQFKKEEQIVFAQLVH